MDKFYEIADKGEVDLLQSRYASKGVHKAAPGVHALTCRECAFSVQQVLTKKASLEIALEAADHAAETGHIVNSSISVDGAVTYEAAIEPGFAREAVTRDFNISRQYADITYSNTGLKEEKLELERHISKMINDGIHSYKYIRDFLIGLNYQNADIIRTFRKLTGADPNELMDPSSYMASPPSIPGLSMAWGESKDSKYDYYFLNLYDQGVGMFGQKGDLQRDLVDIFATHAEAMKEIEKKTKVLYSFDPFLAKESLSKESTELSPAQGNPATMASELDALKGLFREGSVDRDGFASHLSSLVRAMSVTPDEAEEAMFWLETDAPMERTAATKGRTTRERALIMRIKEKGLSKLSPKEVHDALPDYGFGEITEAVRQIRRKAAGPKSVTYKGKTFKTNDPYELAGEMMEIDGAEEGDEATADQYFQRAETLLKQAGLSVSADVDALEMDMREEVTKTEKAIKDRPVSDMLNDRTPQDFFDSNKDQNFDVGSAESIQKVLGIIKEKSDETPGFGINVHSYQYHTLPASEAMFDTVRIEGDEVEEFFASNAVISVVLDLTDKSLPDSTKKKALAVFTVEGGNVKWDGIVKAADDKFYALSVEGLAKLFEMNRLEEEQKRQREL